MTRHQNRTARLVLAVTIGLTLASPAAATTTPGGYSLTGTASSVPGGDCLDCTAPTMNATGTATCSACVAGEPTTGSFTIDTGVATFPPTPCKVKSLSGTIEVPWGNGTTSTAPISGRFHDSKALALS